MKLYSVEFKWTNGYNDPKNAGFVAISLCVASEGQFQALTAAWAMLSTLNLAEPKSFSAQEVGK